MENSKRLHLTNSLTGFTIALREDDGRLIFKERIERKPEGYSRTDLNKIFRDSYKKLKANNANEARIVVDGLNHNNVNYVLQKFREKGFGFLSIKVNVIASNQIDPAKKIKSDIEIEWNMIKAKLEKMEKDESKFIEVVGSQPNGLLFSSNIKRLVGDGYNVRLVSMRSRVKYIIMKD